MIRKSPVRGLDQESIIIFTHGSLLGWIWLDTLVIPSWGFLQVDVDRYGCVFFTSRF